MSGDLFAKPLKAMSFGILGQKMVPGSPPSPTPPTPMPDPEAQDKAKKRIIQQAQAASGRDSTILSSTDKLGG